MFLSYSIMPLYTYVCCASVLCLLCIYLISIMPLSYVYYAAVLFLICIYLSYVYYAAVLFLICIYLSYVFLTECICLYCFDCLILSIFVYQPVFLSFLNLCVGLFFIYLSLCISFSFFISSGAG